MINTEIALFIPLNEMLIIKFNIKYNKKNICIKEETLKLRTYGKIAKITYITKVKSSVCMYDNENRYTDATNN